MKRRIIIGISGASGVIYGVRTLQHLSGRDDIETHLVLSEGGALNLKIETDVTPEELKEMADVVHRPNNLAASIASGSFLTLGMMVMPCSIKSLSGIVNSYGDNLLTRAADVCLKEKRKLLLAVRETPLHKGHLKMMAKADDLGAMILPPMPAFYHQPKSIKDIVDQTVGKAFDYFEIEHDLFRRWGQGEN
ncbi:MAG: UbiX family flavin prenyltransferase [Rubripirellula sp.]|jgi:4-hydroxy-3-polyprenylbenzoate decarboxylase|nr:UbiX family flavin prenyltransferase [Rubripirellula sp.]MDA9778080.1 UbiX family flavin prenyltransferase [Rubripirellula sp.]